MVHASASSLTAPCLGSYAQGKSYCLVAIEVSRIAYPITSARSSYTTSGGATRPPARHDTQADPARPRSAHPTRQHRSARSPACSACPAPRSTSATELATTTRPRAGSCCLSARSSVLLAYLEVSHDADWEVDLGRSAPWGAVRVFAQYPAPVPLKVTGPPEGQQTAGGARGDESGVHSPG